MKINFNSAVNAVKQLNNVKFGSKLPDIGDDVFVKSTETKVVNSKLKQAEQDAIEYCKESLKTGNQYEQSYVITRDGDFVYKNVGEEMSCRLEPQLLQPHSVVYHSHPHHSDDLVPLSPNDVWNLLSQEDLDKVVAVNKNGQTCSLEKKSDFMQMFIKDDTRDEVFEMFEKTWCDALGVHAEYDDAFIKGLEEQLKEKRGIPSEIFDQAIYGGKKPKKNKDIYKHLKAYLMMSGLDYSTPSRRGYKSCQDTVGKIQHEPEGIAIQKMFNERVAERFGLIFEYNK